MSRRATTKTTQPLGRISKDPRQLSVLPVKLHPTLHRLFKLYSLALDTSMTSLVEEFITDRLREALAEPGVLATLSPVERKYFAEVLADYGKEVVVSRQAVAYKAKIRREFEQVIIEKYGKDAYYGKREYTTIE